MSFGARDGSRRFCLGQQPCWRKMPHRAPCLILCGCFRGRDDGRQPLTTLPRPRRLCDDLDHETADAARETCAGRCCARGRNDRRRRPGHGCRPGLRLYSWRLLPRWPSARATRSRQRACRPSRRAQPQGLTPSSRQVVRAAAPRALLGIGRWAGETSRDPDARLYPDHAGPRLLGNPAPCRLPPPPLGDAAKAASTMASAQLWPGQADVQE